MKPNLHSKLALYASKIRSESQRKHVKRSFYTSILTAQKLTEENIR